MWLLVDAGLCSRQELRTVLTIDDFMEAYEFLQVKRVAEAKQYEAMAAGMKR